MVVGASITAQSKHVNVKKGYAANGYDVVAYFDGMALEGIKEHSTKYKEINYKFSSEKNLRTFLANPEKYIPQYGGYCAYAVAISGKKVNINPKTYEIRDGKLYLFYNAGKTNTLELWVNESPEELQDKADQNWKKIVNK